MMYFSLLSTLINRAYATSFTDFNYLNNRVFRLLKKYSDKDYIRQQYLEETSDSGSVIGNDKSSSSSIICNDNLDSQLNLFMDGGNPCAKPKKSELLKSRRLSKRRNPDVTSEGPSTNVRLRGFKQKTKVSRHYLHNSGISLPWTDSVLHAVISSNNPDSIPERIKEVSSREVYASDAETVEVYRGSTRPWSKSVYKMFTASGLSAAKQMGIIKPDHSLFQTISIKDAVEHSRKPTSAGFPTYKKKNSETAILDTERWLRQLYRKPTVKKIFYSSACLSVDYPPCTLR